VTLAPGREGLGETTTWLVVLAAVIAPEPAGAQEESIARSVVAQGQVTRENELPRGPESAPARVPLPEATLPCSRTGLGGYQKEPIRGHCRAVVTPGARQTSPPTGAIDV